MNDSTRPLNTINVHDPFAMRYWARQLRISEPELRTAIAVAGNSTAAVRQHVAKLPPEPRQAGRPR